MPPSGHCFKYRGARFEKNRLVLGHGSWEHVQDNGSPFFKKTKIPLLKRRELNSAQTAAKYMPCKEMNFFRTSMKHLYLGNKSVERWNIEGSKDYGGYCCCQYFKYEIVLQLTLAACQINNAFCTSLYMEVF